MNGVLRTAGNYSVDPTDIYLFEYSVFATDVFLKYVSILFIDTHDSSDALYDSNSHWNRTL
jgi:hypothetical protein